MRTPLREDENQSYREKNTRHCYHHRNHPSQIPRPGHQPHKPHETDRNTRDSAAIRFDSLFSILYPLYTRTNTSVTRSHVPPEALACPPGGRTKVSTPLKASSTFFRTRKNQTTRETFGGRKAKEEETEGCPPHVCGARVTECQGPSRRAKRNDEARAMPRISPPCIPSVEYRPHVHQVANAGHLLPSR